MEIAYLLSNPNYAIIEDRNSDRHMGKPVWTVVGNTGFEEQTYEGQAIVTLASSSERRKVVNVALPGDGALEGLQFLIALKEMVRGRREKSWKRVV